ncbi:nitrogen regulatory protein P-II 1 [Thermosulfidibacter takaii ABI70S6]|uniref:Nitrogen regulatory protein P-II 1 n=1 Tax=Thermosulfidibacter takaii (strain DSM 17441 / JCM 13301 / NBRC 103674 / ABI70S6) TaxID=1298851 RepID=A0A0S3QSP8_THET7|nr:P-II family nitrogen regulator [Thermosulfidibacter takaii]BAT71333.1 nitrogen regulatory protein P-II 1 [Thermosulfidibacter takaii ABI70S6]
MKKVAAIIRPFKLDEIKDRLGEVGVRGLVVTEVKFEDLDGGSGLKELGFSVGFSPRLKIETVVPDDIVDDVIDVILEVSMDGTTGSEWLIVVDVKDAVRIRTGERGEEVL